MLLRSAHLVASGPCEGCATFVNPAAKEILGWKAEGLIGRNIHTAIYHTHADGADYCLQECPIFAAFKDGAALLGIDRSAFDSRSWLDSVQ